MRTLGAVVFAALVCLGFLAVVGFQGGLQGNPLDAIRAEASEPVLRSKAADEVSRTAKEYAKALLAATQDSKLGEDQQLAYWAQLARLGDMSAFERISRLPGESGFGIRHWEETLEQVAVDESTAKKLLKNEKRELRSCGIFLAGLWGMRDELREYGGKDVDPENKRLLWICRGMARDSSIIPALIAVAADKRSPEADAGAARSGLAAYWGEKGEMSNDEFRKRLETLLEATRPAAEPGVK